MVLALHVRKGAEPVFLDIASNSRREADQDLLFQWERPRQIVRTRVLIIRRAAALGQAKVTRTRRNVDGVLSKSFKRDDLQGTFVG